MNRSIINKRWVHLISGVCFFGMVLCAVDEHAAPVFADEQYASADELAGGTAPPLALAPFDLATAKHHQEAWAKHWEVPVEVKNSIGMKLICIPPGKYQRGTRDGEGGQDEEPRHWVKISQGFYVGMYPVTQGEYTKVIGRNPSYFDSRNILSSTVRGMDTTDFPVESVNWYEAIEFCNKLSLLEELPPHYKLTLPSLS